MTINVFDVQSNLTFLFVMDCRVVMDKIQSKSMFGTEETWCCNTARPLQIGLLFLYVMFI